MVMQYCRARKGHGVFKIIAILVALFSATPAQSEPISTAIVTAIAGATFAASTAGFIAIAALTLAITYGATALATSLIGGGRRQSDIMRELQMPNSLPLYRFVYGQCRAPGTPAPIRVKGGILYACYILNSRPSAGPFTVYLDKRAVSFTGDPYNFSGSGASGTNGLFLDHVRYWIGRGDQTGPPSQIRSEAPELFSATDGWQGLTVLWIRLDAGGEKNRQTRWPSAPPEVMVDGRWSLVLDPRNPSAPPAWSANQALCVLDALRNNPLHPYDDRNLWLDTFKWAADVADSAFPVKSGGTIPRFQVNGVLPFSDGEEIESQILPLADAGASRIIRVGGLLGIAPAVYSEPVATITDVLGDQPMTFNRYRPSSELVTEVSANYTSPARTYEEAATPQYILVGAQTEDGGVAKLGQFNLRMVTDYRQAQYVAAIKGRRTRMQKSWSGVLGADAFDLVACSPVQLDLPAPYTGRNGLYEIEEIHPGGDMVGQSGFAMRCSVSMRENSPDIYDWNPAVDEQDIATETFNPNIPPISPVASVALASDGSTSIITGGVPVARVRFSFPPSVSASASAYEWQFQLDGGAWQSGGLIDGDVDDGSGNVFGFITPAIVGGSYKVRIWALSPTGSSDPTDSGTITASAGSSSVEPPTPISATGGAGKINVIFQSPNSGLYNYMEIWVNSTDTTVGATLLFGPLYGSANTATEQEQTGLGSGITRYYFGRSFDINGAPSAFSASISGTTT